MSIEFAENKQHLVVKRNGSVEPYDKEKMYKVLYWACDGRKALIESILNSVDIKIYNKIHIETLFDEVLDTTYNMISQLTPVYEEVAKKLYIQKTYKEHWGIKRNEYPSLIQYFDTFGNNELIDIYQYFTKDELKYLDEFVKPERDLRSSYLGLQVFFEKYSIRGKELLQHGFMRMAIQAYINELKEKRLGKIVKRYNNLSLGIYTEATPKFKNSLRKKFYGTSCCVHKMDDNSESINDTCSDIGQYSRADGGNACDVSDLRASGSSISTVGSSSGPVPFIKKIEAAVNAFNQNNEIDVA